MEMSSVDLSKLDMAVDRAGSKAELSRRICRNASFISQVYCHGQISMRDAKQILVLYGINVIGKDIPLDAPPIKKEAPKTPRTYKKNNVAISTSELNAVIEKAGSMRKVEEAIGSKSHGFLSKVIVSKRMSAEAIDIIKERWGIDITESPKDDEKTITKSSVGRFSWYGKELLEVFDSKEQACKKFGSNVEKVLNNEWNYCYGYKFEYLISPKRKDLKVRTDISLSEPIAVVNIFHIMLFDNYDSFMSCIFSDRNDLGSTVAQVEYDFRMILRGEKEPSGLKWFRKIIWIGYEKNLPDNYKTLSRVHYNGSELVPIENNAPVVKKMKENIEKPAEVSNDQSDIQKQILDGINELVKIGRAQNDHLRNISAKLDAQSKISTDTRDMFKNLDGLFPAIMDQIRRAR